jgi:membrane protease YdiL (CAAX protease family)
MERIRIFVYKSSEPSEERHPNYKHICWPAVQQDVRSRLTEETQSGPGPVAIAFATVLAVFLAVNAVRRDVYALSPALYWAIDVLKFVVLPAAAAVALAKRYSIFPRHYGLRSEPGRNDWGHFIGLTVFLALTLNLVYHATRYVAWLLLRPEPATSFYFDINASGLLRIPVTLYMAVTAGVVEEVFFRGLPLLYLERRFPNAVPKRLYVAGTALAFGLIHWMNGPHEFIATFVFGVLAATLYLRLRDLRLLIGAHICIDLYGFA